MSHSISNEEIPSNEDTNQDENRDILGDDQQDNVENESAFVLNVSDEAIKLRAEIRSLPEFAQVISFLHTFRTWASLSHYSINVLEQSFLFPEGTRLLGNLIWRLCYNKNSPHPGTLKYLTQSYRRWRETAFDQWHDILRERMVEVAEIYEIDNPLGDRSYESLSLKERLDLLLLLIQYQLDFSETLFRDCHPMNEEGISHLRSEPLGSDVDGNIFWQLFPEDAWIWCDGSKAAENEKKARKAASRAARNKNTKEMKTTSKTIKSTKSRTQSRNHATTRFDTKPKHRHIAKSIQGTGKGSKKASLTASPVAFSPRTSRHTRSKEIPISKEKVDKTTLLTPSLRSSSRLTRAALAAAADSDQTESDNELAEPEGSTSDDVENTKESEDDDDRTDDDENSDEENSEDDSDTEDNNTDDDNDKMTDKEHADESSYIAIDDSTLPASERITRRLAYLSSRHCTSHWNVICTSIEEIELLGEYLLSPSSRSTTSSFYTTMIAPSVRARAMKAQETLGKKLTRDVAPALRDAWDARSRTLERRRKLEQAPRKRSGRVRMTIEELDAQEAERSAAIEEERRRTNEAIRLKREEEKRIREKARILLEEEMERERQRVSALARIKRERRRTILRELRTALRAKLFREGLIAMRRDTAQRLAYMTNTPEYVRRITYSTYFDFNIDISMNASGGKVSNEIRPDISTLQRNLEDSNTPLSVILVLKPETVIESRIDPVIDPMEEIPYENYASTLANHAYAHYAVRLAARQKIIAEAKAKAAAEAAALREKERQEAAAAKRDAMEDDDGEDGETRSERRGRREKEREREREREQIRQLEQAQASSLSQSNQNENIDQTDVQNHQTNENDGQIDGEAAIPALEIKGVPSTPPLDFGGLTPEEFHAFIIRAFEVDGGEVGDVIWSKATALAAILRAKAETEAEVDIDEGDMDHDEEGDDTEERDGGMEIDPETAASSSTLSQDHDSTLLSASSSTASNGIRGGFRGARGGRRGGKGSRGRAARASGARGGTARGGIRGGIRGGRGGRGGLHGLPIFPSFLPLHHGLVDGQEVFKAPPPLLETYFSIPPGDSSDEDHLAEDAALLAPFPEYFTKLSQRFSPTHDFTERQKARQKALAAEMEGTQNQMQENDVSASASAYTDSYASKDAEWAALEAIELGDGTLGPAVPASFMHAVVSLERFSISRDGALIVGGISLSHRVFPRDMISSLQTQLQSHSPVTSRGAVPGCLYDEAGGVSLGGLPPKFPTYPTGPIGTTQVIGPLVPTRTRPLPRVSVMAMRISSAGEPVKLRLRVCRQDLVSFSSYLSGQPSVSSISGYESASLGPITTITMPSGPTVKRSKKGTNETAGSSKINHSTGNEILSSEEVDSLRRTENTLREQAMALTSQGNELSHLLQTRLSALQAKTTEFYTLQTGKVAALTSFIANSPLAGIVSFDGSSLIIAQQPQLGSDGNPTSTLTPMQIPSHSMPLYQQLQSAVQQYHLQLTQLYNEQQTLNNSKMELERQSMAVNQQLNAIVFQRNEVLAALRAHEKAMKDATIDSTQLQSPLQPVKKRASTKTAVGKSPSATPVKTPKRGLAAAEKPASESKKRKSKLDKVEKEDKGEKNDTLGSGSISSEAGLEIEKQQQQQYYDTIHSLQLQQNQKQTYLQQLQNMGTQVQSEIAQRQGRGQGQGESDAESTQALQSLQSQLNSITHAINLTQQELQELYEVHQRYAQQQPQSAPTTNVNTNTKINDQTLTHLQSSTGLLSEMQKSPPTVDPSLPMQKQSTHTQLGPSGQTASPASSISLPSTSPISGTSSSSVSSSLPTSGASLSGMNTSDFTQALLDVYSTTGSLTGMVDGQGQSLPLSRALLTYDFFQHVVHPRLSESRDLILHPALPSISLEECPVQSLPVLFSTVENAIAHYRRTQQPAIQGLLGRIMQLETSILPQISEELGKMNVNIAFILAPGSDVAAFAAPQIQSAYDSLLRQVFEFEASLGEFMRNASADIFQQALQTIQSLKAERSQEQELGNTPGSHAKTSEQGEH